MIIIFYFFADISAYVVNDPPQKEKEMDEEA